MRAWPNEGNVELQLLGPVALIVDLRGARRIPPELDDCVDFVFDSASGERKSFLRGDLSVECWTDKHAQIQNTAYVFLAIWPLGMPFLYLLLLLPSRGAFVNKRTTLLTRATSFLHAEYYQKYFWWEPLFLLQRLLVTGFVMVFFQEELAIRRVLFGIGVTISYMAMLLAFRPYARRDLNILAAIGAQCTIAFSMQIALCLRIFNEIADRFSVEAAREITTFEGPSQVRTCRERLVMTIALTKPSFSLHRVLFADGGSLHRAGLCRPRHGGHQKYV
jgi:hypothetical protein